MRLAGETVLVTGSTSGIGRHTALLCAREGARVAVHGRNAERGAIVNVSSRQAERASAGLAAYVASKGGLNALTRSIAVDYARDGIRCNALSVGYVVNARRDAAMTAERRMELAGMHLTRLGHPDDVAYAVVYLASRESEFVTGALLPVDGGGTIARGRVLG